MSSKGCQNVDNVEIENLDVSNVEDGDGEHDLEIIYQDLNATLRRDWSLQTTSKRIGRLPKWTTTGEMKKYYIPQVVSIGPYHYGKKELKSVQDLKLDFARGLFLGEKHKLSDLHENLHVRLKKLREDYDDEATKDFPDTAFANMMLLDGCFILYYILLSCGHHFDAKKMLSNHQMICIRQDLFLHENQIPFEVLQMVISRKDGSNKAVRQFIVDSTPTPGKPKVDFNRDKVYHLLDLLRLSLIIKNPGLPRRPSSSNNVNGGMQDASALPTVTELIDAGFHFKKNSTTLLNQIDFSKSLWWCMFRRATVKLPPIIVEEGASSKYLFLNLVAYEASSHKQNDMWVTAYICLLNSLISRSKDVKHLRDAGVFADSEGSDSQIKWVIKEIAAAGRVPDDKDYFWEIKDQIQQFYDQFKCCNIPFSQLKETYFSSPWSAIALAGAILALFLTAVQTYFTVWSPKSECDDLCKFLKLNHHL